MISIIKKLYLITLNRVGYHFIILILLSLSAVLIEMFGIGLVIPLFDLISGTNTVSSYFSDIFRDFFNYFNLPISYEIVLSFIVIAFIIKSLLMFVINLFTVIIGTNVSRNLRLDLLKLMENVEFLYHTNQRSGQNTNALTQETERYTSTIKNFVEVLVSLISFFIFIIFAGAISPEIVLFIFILLILTSIIFLPIIKKTKTYSISNTEHYSRTQSSLLELINNFLYLKSTNSTNNFIHSIKKRIDALKKISIRLNIFSSLITFTKEPLGVTFFSVIIYVYVVRQGQSFGEIIMLAFIVYRITQKVLDLQNFWKRVNDSIGGVFEIENSIKSLGSSQEENLGAQKANFNNKISFKSVDLIISKKKVLSNISFEINPRKTLGIFGPSGSGKSSLIYLVTKLLKPSVGEIFMADENFNNIENQSLRSKIGYVSQDISLFHGSISENVSLRDHGDDRKVKNDEIIKALNLAGCAELSRRLDFDVGENGRKLSGGQRQRISIAREIYKNPDLFIFDEATSALDLKSEKIIRETIDKLSGKKTILLISHKISLLEHCDNIIVIYNGEINQNGTFKKLISKKGFFKTMYDSEKIKKS